MRRFRSYFSKSNTIVKDSLLNSSQNPVTEICYGGEHKIVSRFLFDIDIKPLKEKIEKGQINPENIIAHKLHLTNTIFFTPRYIGKTTYNSNVDRASSFALDLFTIDEDWDEGSGYDLYLSPKANKNQPSNWIYKKTNTEWINTGAYTSGITETIKTIPFDKGNENIEIDITDHIDDMLLDPEVSGTTLGLKFIDDLENLKTPKMSAVGFHTNRTNTFYQPYVETILSDEIIDDRNFFYKDKKNTICFSLNEKHISDTSGFTINSVKIYDHEGLLFEIIEAPDIKYLGFGVYAVELEVSSTDYPDNIIFYDEWEYQIGDKIFKYKDRFHILSTSDYFLNNIGLNNENYNFFLFGVSQGEKIKRGEIRKIKITVKELYASADNLQPKEIEYRLYTIIENKNEVEMIPFTHVNRIKNNYEFILDTSWLLPQDYTIEIRLKNSINNISREKLSFQIH